MKQTGVNMKLPVKVDVNHALFFHASTHQWCLQKLHRVLSNEDISILIINVDGMQDSAVIEQK